MAFILVIIAGIAARYLIPGPRDIIGFAKTISISVAGAVLGALLTAAYWYMTYKDTPVKTNYGYETRPLPDAFGIEMVTAGVAGAVVLLIIYGLIVRSASQRKPNNA